MKNKKVFWKRRKDLLVMVLAIIFAIFLAEFFLRFFEPFLVDGYYYNDQYLYWKINPTWNINSQGFQEQQICFEELDEENLIYAVGDSFAYGAVGYEDNYLTIIDEELKDWNVINLGVFAYSPHQYLKQIKRYSNIKKPKAVFLNLYTGNDIVHNKFTESRRVAINGALSGDHHVLTAYTLRSSALLRFTNAYFEHFFSRSSSEKQKKIPKTKWLGLQQIINRIRLDILGQCPKTSFEESGYKDLGGFETVKYDPEMFNLFLFKEIRLYKEEYVKNTETNLSLALSDIGDIVNYCNKKDIELYVFIMPTEMQVDQPYREEFLADNNLSAKHYDFDKPQKMLTNFLEKREVDYVDILPAMRMACQAKACYIPYNTHWNVFGNKKAAEIIIENLTQGGILGQG